MGPLQTWGEDNRPHPGVHAFGDQKPFEERFLDFQTFFPLGSAMGGILGCVDFWEVLGGVSGLCEIARKPPCSRSVRLHDEKKLFFIRGFRHFFDLPFSGFVV